VVLKYYAKKIFMVAGADSIVNVGITVGGVAQKSVPIKDEKLYTLATFDTATWRTIKIDIPASANGLKLFTFTFE
jgi:hypothetical protein